MKWLIYGKGWIGNQVKDYLDNNFNYDVNFGNSRVDNKQTSLEEINLIKPDRILCLIGRTHGENYSTIDYLELPGKLKDNIRDNLFSPVMLSIICKEMNIHLTYLGTGCIFNYDSEHTKDQDGFTEEDEPNFLDQDIL